MAITLTRNFATALGQTVHVRGHEIASDATLAEGGEDTGPSPHDLYDAALGACKAITVMWYARKKGMVIDDLRVSVERDDSQERSGTYRLSTNLLVRGALSDAQLAELEAVAKKCPVHTLMSTVVTEITTSMGRLP
jgi:putative redox protein